MAQVAGNRATDVLIDSENRLIRQVDDNIALLDPNATPLITFTMKMKGKRMATKSPRIEWLEDDYVARWTQMSATTAATTGDTTLNVVDGTLFVAGDVIMIPKAASDSGQPEILRVNDVSSNQIGVTRGIGASSPGTIAVGSAIRLIGSAEEEGATPPSQKSTIIATRINYTQIFKTTVDLTNTAIESAVYGVSSERKRLHRKKLVEHKQKLNAAALWGVKSEDNSGGPSGNPIRYTEGINSVIASNITDSNGMLTKRIFETFSRSVFRYGSKRKLLLCSPIVISAIQEWGDSYMNTKAGQKVLGVDVSTINTGHGIFMICNDWMLEDGVSGGNGFGGVAFAIDLDNCEYRYLQNRDTKVTMDVIKDGRDAKVDEILTEGGFVFKQEQTHGKLFNVTDYSA